MTDSSYVVAYTGGCEEPSFAAFSTWSEASECAHRWIEEGVYEEGDRVDVLLLDHEDHRHMERMLILIPKLKGIPHG